MSLKHYLFPEVIKTYTSKINDKVEVVKFLGKLRLDMGGLTQSGEIIESIWNSGLSLLPRSLQPIKILILGLGAGSAAKIISKRWPLSAITGIEIDPVVIDIGKKHFHLDKINNLEIINQDAIAFMKDKNTPSDFDLILVDCYQGYHIPEALENIKFIAMLKSKTNHLLINRLVISVS